MAAAAWQRRGRRRRRPQRRQCGGQRQAGEGSGGGDVGGGGFGGSGGAKGAGQRSSLMRARSPPSGRLEGPAQATARPFPAAASLPARRAEGGWRRSAAASTLSARSLGMPTIPARVQTSVSAARCGECGEQPQRRGRRSQEAGTPKPQRERASEARDCRYSQGPPELHTAALRGAAQVRRGVCLAQKGHQVQGQPSL